MSTASGTAVCGFEHAHLRADDPATVPEFRTGAGASNAYPQVGPVVISEIMFEPPRLGTNDNVRDEYIELYNSSSVPVPLFDSLHPTNTWRFRNEWISPSPPT